MINQELVIPSTVIFEVINAGNDLARFCENIMNLSDAKHREKLTVCYSYEYNHGTVYRKLLFNFYLYLSFCCINIDIYRTNFNSVIKFIQVITKSSISRKLKANISDILRTLVNDN